MRIYAYITPACVAAAAKHTFSDEVHRLQEKVESDQSLGSWDRFLPSPFIRKKLGRFRLIAELREVGSVSVVCFRDLMARGDPRYQTFSDSPESYGPATPEAEITDWLKVRLSDPLPELNPPTTSESCYLYPQGRSGHDQVVFETAQWVEEVERFPAETRGWLLDALLESVIDGNAEPPVVQHRNMAIVFRRLVDGGTLLIEPISEANPAKVQAALEKHGGILKVDGLTEEDVRRVSRRAYPAIVVADSLLWFAIQKDEAANLALSSEELAVLESVFAEGNTEARFPLFINGRPGSGKSTVLQYAFAEYASRYLKESSGDLSVDVPLYLTYSEPLLRTARLAVEQLVKCNASIQLATQLPSEAQLRSILDRCFQLLHVYLREMLPPSDSAAFPLERRVTFSDFRALWTKRALGPRFHRLSPELAWHVLRTYVKGMKDDDENYLDPDAYQDLPAKRRTVTLKTYRQVYDEVWGGWFGQHCADNGLWDDQDLTRRALDTLGTELARHPVVFCDEAQDFTRNELELIARLSLFTRRSLGPQEVRRVPIAFAGDPFQTLNPTGFQWASVGARFHEQIVKELDPSKRAALEFNFQELAFNYRSTPAIVGFCNLIQAIRGAVFGIGSLRPQLTWSREIGPLPSIFSASDPATIRNLSDQDEIVIILPCQDGEEDAFIGADPELSSLAEGGAIRNFLSPMAAKGLEFSRVVLYKFGQEYLEQHSVLLTPVETGEPHTDPDTALPLEYFVNRLYVAASRPKRRLFIVDTPEAIHALWASALLRDIDSLLLRLPHAAQNGWDSSHIAAARPGIVEDWSDDRDDPLRLGEQFFAEGRANRSSYLLRLAEANYRRAGADPQATECLAERLEIEGDFLGAGRAHRDIARAGDALRCFWKAGAYEELAGIVEAGERPEIRAARFMASRRTHGDAAALLDSLVMDGEVSAGVALRVDGQWSRIVDELAEAMAVPARKGERVDTAYSQLLTLEQAGWKINRSSALADIAFAARDFHRAAAMWGGGSPPRDPERRRDYEIARAESEPFPQNLTWYSSLGRHGDVVREVLQKPLVDLDGDALETAVAAFVVEGRVAEALAHFRQGASKRRAMALLLASGVDQLDEGQVSEVSHDLMMSYVSANDWSGVLDLLTNVLPLEARGHVEEGFVEEMASSHQLVHNTRKEERERIAAYVWKLAQSLTARDSERMKTLGAAIERAGHHVNALEYYERVWKRRDSLWLRADVHYAERRWVRCKLRQAEWSREAGRRGDWRQQKADAEEKLRQWGVTAGSIAEYPDTNVDPPVARPRRLSGKSLSPEQVDAVLLMSEDPQHWPPERIARVLHIPVELVRSVTDTQSET